MNNNEEDVIIFWEAPKIVPPEFRLYYEKDTGKVICYTCEKLDGDYIIIDAITYAQARPDVRVLNEKISTVQNHCIVSKLMPNLFSGQDCEAEDVSIINIDKINSVKWKLNTYELK